MKGLIVRPALMLSIISQIACSSGTKNIVLERNIDLQSVDLTEYAAAGFFVTPHVYGGDYDVFSFFQISGQDRVVVVRTASAHWRKVYSKEGHVTLDEVLEVAVFSQKRSAVML